MVIFITLLFITITGIHLKYLLKRGKTRESFAVIIIMAISLFYTYNAIYQWRFPQPMQGIENIYEPVQQFIFSDLLKY